MDDIDIQQIAEQRKESYDIKQMDKEFEASQLMTGHKAK